jgi:hypothetical protein
LVRLLVRGFPGHPGRLQRLTADPEGRLPEPLPLEFLDLGLGCSRSRQDIAFHLPGSESGTRRLANRPH